MQGDGGGAGEILGVAGQLAVAVGFDVVVDAAGHGVALVVDVGAVRRRAQLVGRFVLVLHDEEVLVAIVGDVGAEGIQALELLHHVVGLRLADDGPASTRSKYGRPYGPGPRPLRRARPVEM